LPPSRNFPQRALAIGYFAAPILLGLILYWPGLTAWFQMDDFAWLGLRDLVRNGRSIWWALFAPLAQGTIRTLSERVFYLTFTSLFGLHPLPFRIWAFFTFAATLPLLSLVCTRLTGSRAVGFWATILWTVNSGLAAVLSWTAVYYELLCSFFFVLNFWLLLRYVDTGERRYYIAQCATFVLGFGVLELNVVYPALATLYALCCARRILTKVVPLFAGSVLYMAFHLVISPLPANGPYKTYWDTSVFATLATYWKWALGPTRLILLGVHPSHWRSAITTLLTVGIIGFLVWKLWRREWIAAFLAAWFVIVLAPLLPLRDHIHETYLPVPLIGLAMCGAWALVSGWRAGLAGKIAAAALLCIYIGVAIPITRSVTLSYNARGKRIQKMVLGVNALSHQEPEKVVLLKGLNTELFWCAVYHRAFRLFGVRDVYIVPDDAGNIAPDPQGNSQPFFIDPVVAKLALEHGKAMVLDVGDQPVRNITAAYLASPEMQSVGAVGSRVDAGNEIFASHLGSTWYPAEGGFRWMPKSATVTLRGPRGPGEKLYLSGFCPDSCFKPGPLEVQVSIDGAKLNRAPIRQPGQFSFTFDLPGNLVGRPSVEVALELSRTFHVSSDSRDLGLAFGVFEIR
jgi:hypothetical protein